MASKESAIRNDLNRRAREVGIFDQELTLEDLAAVRAFYDFTCLNPACRKTPAISIDHVKPLINGGSNTRENLQLLCTECNKAKQDQEIDYREGKVVPPDFVAPNAEEKTYKRHDWKTIRSDYISSTATLRELAAKYNVSLATIGERASAEGWTNDREQLANKIRTGTIDELAKEGISSRVMTAKVTEQATLRYLDDNPKVKLGDLVQALKLLGVYEGLPTDRVVTENESDVDDSDFVRAAEQVARRADRRREAEVYRYDSEAEEGMGAGWSD